jgi:hypothetical protein
MEGMALDIVEIKNKGCHIIIILEFMKIYHFR